MSKDNKQEIAAPPEINTTPNMGRQQLFQYAAPLTAVDTLYL